MSNQRASALAHCLVALCMLDACGPSLDSGPSGSNLIGAGVTDDTSSASEDTSPAGTTDTGGNTSTDSAEDTSSYSDSEATSDTELGTNPVIPTVDRAIYLQNNSSAPIYYARLLEKPAVTGFGTESTQGRITITQARSTGLEWVDPCATRCDDRASRVPTISGQSDDYTVDPDFACQGEDSEPYIGEMRRVWLACPLPPQEKVLLSLQRLPAQIKRARTRVKGAGSLVTCGYIEPLIEADFPVSVSLPVMLSMPLGATETGIPAIRNSSDELGAPWGCVVPNTWFDLFGDGGPDGFVTEATLTRTLNVEEALQADDIVFAYP